MQAIVYHRYGTPDVLTLEDIPKPVPAAEEALIAVRTASVNPYD
jgi:NADPH:quinone reductase-like Zn-dependent oxidoreductase